MDPDLSALDAHLDEVGVDGYLLDAAQDDSDQLYVSGFTGPDPFLTLRANGSTSLLVSGLEYGRATEESNADTVERHADYGFEYGDREAKLDMYAEFVADKGVDSVLVPARGPVETADALRERGVDVAVDDDNVVTRARAVKTTGEVEHVRRTQRANEAAMRAAEALIAAADVVGDGAGDDAIDGSDDTTADDTADPEPGTLVHEGTPLTSERVKEEIEVTLLRHGCALDETIVSCGAAAADPHDRGSGPLVAGEPIIVDIFPREKASKYHADMTRTFTKGEPTGTVREWFDLTEAALDAALDAIEPGVSGEAVHAAACEVYEAAGQPTFRTDPETETGFIHSTGHGVGLDVHELPRLANGGDELEPGNVVTVEPGLYDPAVGGVRIEDLVVVTEDGFENLTDYPVELVIE